MTKEEILDYIMETPGNTNRQILSYLLDEINGGGDIKRYEYVKIAEDDYEVSPSQTIEDVNEGVVDCTSMPTGDTIKIYFGEEEFELPLNGKSEEYSYYGDIDELTGQPIFDEYPVGITFTLNSDDVPIATIYSPESEDNEYSIVIMDYKEVPADYSFLPVYEATVEVSSEEGVIRLTPSEAIEPHSLSFILHGKRGSVDIYSIINIHDLDEMTAITYVFSEDSVSPSGISFGSATLTLDETAIDIVLGYYPPQASLNMVEATIYKDALLDSSVKISIINSEEVSEHSAREKITLTDISNTDVNNKYACKFLQNTEYEVLIEQEGEEEDITVAAKINDEENSSLSYIGGTCYLVIGEYSQDIDIKFTLSDEK